MCKYAKQLKDHEIDIKFRFPEADFVDGKIINAEVSDEEREEYLKEYEIAIQQ